MGDFGKGKGGKELGDERFAVGDSSSSEGEEGGETHVEIKL